MDAPVSPTSISKRQQGLPPLVEFARTEPEREAYTTTLRRVVRGVPSKEDILIVPIQIQSLSQLPLSKFRRVLARSVPAIPTGILEISVKGPMPDQALCQLTGGLRYTLSSVPQRHHFIISERPFPDLDIVNLSVPCAILIKPLRL